MRVTRNPGKEIKAYRLEPAWIKMKTHLTGGEPGNKITPI